MQKFRDDFNLLDPMYLKLLMERLMSLDFKDTKEAASFFYGIKQIAVIKNMAIKIHA